MFRIIDIKVGRPYIVLSAYGDVIQILYYNPSRLEKILGEEETKRMQDL